PNIMKKIALHWQILIGILAGILVGILCVQFDAGTAFAVDWIKPFGTIFINLLKLIAIPLIIVSLIKGISDLVDVTQLSSLGIRTLCFYVATTIIAVMLGLGLVNLINPGGFISEDTRKEMLVSFGGEVQQKVDEVEKLEEARGPLQALVDIVPENIFESVAATSYVLQTSLSIFIHVIAVIILPYHEVPFSTYEFAAVNAIVFMSVVMIMQTAPYFINTLLLAKIAEAPSSDVIK